MLVVVSSPRARWPHHAYMIARESIAPHITLIASIGAVRATSRIATGIGQQIFHPCVFANRRRDTNIVHRIPLTPHESLLTSVRAIRQASWVDTGRGRTIFL